MAAAISTLERNVELNPFEDRESGKNPEEEHKVLRNRDSHVEKMLQQYKSLEHIDFDELETHLENMDLLTLSPSKIELAVQRMLNECSKSLIDLWVTGYFISM